MWRSKARVFLSRSSRQSPPSIRNQVPSRTPFQSTVLPNPLIPIPRCPLPTSASRFQNPRFFSLGGRPSSGSDPAEDGGANSSFAPGEPSSVFGTGVGGGGEDGSDVFGVETPTSVSRDSDWSTVFEDAAAAAKDSVFDQDPGFVSQGSNAHPFDFEENVDSGFAESGASLEVFDDMGRSEVDVEDKSHPWGENGEDDSVDTPVPDELVEGSETEIPQVDGEKVEDVLSVLQSDFEEPIESRLNKMELELTEEFMARVLQTPHVLGERLVQFFRWASRKSEFVKTLSTIDLLVKTICSCGDELNKKDAYMLWDLVKEIGESNKELLNMEILNQLIYMFCKLGKAKAGLQVFNVFEEFGLKPDANTYYLTIEALGKRSMFDTAWSVCEKMLSSGSLPDGEKIGKIITFFCKGARAKDAYSVYLMARENKKSPPRSSLDFLIGGLSRKDETLPMALELLEDYVGESRKYAIQPFNKVIVALCRIKDVEAAKKLLSKMINSGPPPGNAVFNHVINALSKSGDVEDAVALMKVMEGRGLRPDVYTYCVIMSGYAKGGLMDEASKIFCEAKKRHPKLSRVAYHVLTRGYCKMEDFDNALKYIREMKENGIKPNNDEYNKMIQSLCLKALDWQTAEKLLVEMKESGLYLKGITRSLIAAVKKLEEEQILSGEVTVKT